LVVPKRIGIGLALVAVLLTGCVPVARNPSTNNANVAPSPPNPPPSVENVPETTNRDPSETAQTNSNAEFERGARTPLSSDLEPGLHTFVYERPGTPHPVNYLLFLPASYRTGARWPTIVYLHGKSLSGDDPQLLTKYGLPKIVSRDPNFPFILLAPQCHEGERWTDVDTLDALLADVSSRVPVDPDRVYLTGFSMGAGGAWRFGGAHPERFAAVAALAGVQDAGSVKGLARLPVWAFHGTDDESTPATESEAMVAAIQAAGGDARLELLQGRNHDIVDVYDRKDLYAWFLAHKRR